MEMGGEKMDGGLPGNRKKEKLSFFVFGFTGFRFNELFNIGLVKEGSLM